MSTAIVKRLEDEKISGAILQSMWSRNGLLASIEETNGRALIAYEEMDVFFQVLYGTECFPYLYTFSS